jgi:Raf kinase inhibitor-like YbhB/YbcL family protein
MVNDPNWRLPEVAEFSLESPDFGAGETLPASTRADGGNRSPALRWSGAPEGTKSFALTLYDPDAPTGSGFWHWAVYDIPAGVTELPAGAGTDASALHGATVLHNELGTAEYTGVAPPPGDGSHRYFFTVSALGVEKLEVPAGATPAVLGFVLRSSILGRAQLVGLAETPA